MEQEARLEDLLSDRYRIERELGRGGMGRVYLAREAKHGRDVAIKVLSPELATGLGAERFLLEIRTTARLSHPHIVAVHDSGEIDGVPYYVMPYVRGESLRERLDRTGPLPVPEAVRLTREVAEALAHAHSHGIVHRDIKPANILLAGGRHACVADFGLARALAVATDTRLTGLGMALGSPSYMSPEQAGGSPDVDARSDIYGLGCVLYEMLVGAPPFTGDDARELLAQHLSAPPPKLRMRRADVSPALEKAALRCLAKDPAARFQSADELEAALEALESRSSAAAVAVDGRRRGPGTAGERSTATAGAPSARRVGGRVFVGVVLAVLAAATAVAVFQRADSPAAAGPGGEAETIGAPLRIAVLPPDRPPGVRPDWPGVIQYGVASELARRPGLAVVEPLSLNTLLAGPSRAGGSDPYAVLAAEDIPYAVRATLIPGSGGVQIRWTLVDTRNGDVAATAASHAGDDAELPPLIRRATDELLAGLDEVLTAAAKAVDLRPWLATGTPPAAAVREFAQGAEYSYVMSGRGRPHFLRALAIDPAFIAPRIWLVSGLLGSGDTTAATAHLDTLRSLKDSASPFEEAMIGWADAAVRGDLAAKAQHLRVALTYSPRNNVLLYVLGQVLVETGQPEEAVQVLGRAVRASWPFSPVYVYWAVASIRAGRTEGVRETLEQALGITPRDPYLYIVLEALARYDGHTAAAQEYGNSFRRHVAADVAARHGEEIAEIFSLLAGVARREGRDSVARDLMNRAAEFAPTRSAAALSTASPTLEE